MKQKKTDIHSQIFTCYTFNFISDRNPYQHSYNQKIRDMKSRYFNDELYENIREMVKINNIQDINLMI